MRRLIFKLIGTVSVALSVGLINSYTSTLHAEDQNPSPSERLKPYADKSHPSFLEAGVFFMTGQEPSDTFKFVVRQDGVVSAIVLRLMNEPNRAAYEAIWEFKLSPDKPCTIIGYKIQPPYEVERLEFLNVPSPRAMRTDPKFSPIYADIMDLPNETWCHAKAYMNDAGKIELVENTSMCDTAVALGQAYNAQRRLAALDYIRANFCPGQPEPPPRPRKPY